MGGVKSICTHAHMDLYVPVSEWSGKPFDKHTHICCDGHLYEYPDEHELTVLCCKDKIYNRQLKSVAAGNVSCPRYM